GGGGAGEVVGIGGGDDVAGGVEGGVGGGERAVVGIETKALLGVADEADAVGDGVEVGAEGGAVEEERAGGSDLGRDAGERVEGVNAAGAADAVQLLVGGSDVDADEGFADLQAG